MDTWPGQGRDTDIHDQHLRLTMGRVSLSQSLGKFSETVTSKGSEETAGDNALNFVPLCPEVLGILECQTLDGEMGKLRPIK